jgi:thiol-disulfide isomerase/thioredoxin
MKMSRQAVRFNPRTQIATFHQSAPTAYTPRATCPGGICTRNPHSAGESLAEKLASGKKVGWADFDAEGMTRDYVLIITADWCGHCKTLKQQIPRVTEFNNVIMVDDRQIQPGTVQGFPMIFRYRNGQRSNMDRNELIQRYQAIMNRHGQ